MILPPPEADTAAGCTGTVLKNLSQDPARTRRSSFGRSSRRRSPPCTLRTQGERRRWNAAKWARPSGSTSKRA